MSQTVRTEDPTVPAARSRRGLTWTARTSPSCRRTCCQGRELCGAASPARPSPAAGPGRSPGAYIRRPPRAAPRADLRPGAASEGWAPGPSPRSRSGPRPGPRQTAVRTAARTPGGAGLVGGRAGGRGRGRRLPAQNQSDQLRAGRLLAQVLRPGPGCPGRGWDPQIGVRLSSLPGTDCARETESRKPGWNGAQVPRSGVQSAPRSPALAEVGGAAPPQERASEALLPAIACRSAEPRRRQGHDSLWCWTLGPRGRVWDSPAAALLAWKAGGPWVTRTGTRQPEATHLAPFTCHLG